MRDYVQVSNIRFWSMVGIVAIHSYIYPNIAGNPDEDPLRLFLIQFFKYGTLCFFMISGFLLGDKLEDYNPVEFFRKRLISVGKPWLFWFSLFTALSILAKLVKNKEINLKEILLNVFFYSEYWFIPNFIIALGCLILFRKYLNHLYFGALLAVISLIYGINIYLAFLPTSHTTAIFGYVFYLWLGYTFRRINLFESIKKIPTSKIILMVLAFYFIGIFEARFVGLYGKSDDIHNTLRIVNQVYSISLFLLLFKFSSRMYPKIFNPRSETFGIYLIHWTILFFWSNLLTKFVARKIGATPPQVDENSMRYISSLDHLLIWLVSFCVIYGASRAITDFVGRTNFYWIVGKPRKE